MPLCSNIFVRFVVNLNSEVDLYDTVLPLCIKTRSMLSLVDGLPHGQDNKKIQIFDGYCLKERWLKLPYAKEFSRDIYHLDNSEMNDTERRFNLVNLYSHIKFCSEAQLDQIQERERNHNTDEPYVCTLMENPELFKEIKHLESDLTTVPLTDAEQKIVDIVLHSKELDGLIESFGFEIYTSVR